VSEGDKSLIIYVGRQTYIDRKVTSGQCDDIRNFY
jgi:hypothetical protein